MSTLFILFAFVIALAIAAVAGQYLPRAYGARVLAGLALWVVYGGALGLTGVIGNAALVPPGMFYLLAPMIALVMFTGRSRAGQAVALSLPLWLLTGAQSFRVVVELFLDQLWRGGQLPTMMTFHGANFDILIGLSAPVVAWLVATRKISDRFVLAWNVCGIALLANVAFRGVLTTPGRLHLISTEVPNLAIGTFPFTYIPGLMVPLALLLHVLSIRTLRHHLKTSGAGNALHAYRFTRLSTSLFLRDLGFSRNDARPGTIIENVRIERLDGSEATLDQVIGGRLTLIVFGSVSCPMTLGSATVLRRLHTEFAEDVRFVMLNVREAHPGEIFDQPQSQEMKRGHARALAFETAGGWETVIDGIDGDLHRLLAEKPNAAYLLAPNRQVLFRSLWAADESGLREALRRVSRGEPVRRRQSTAIIGPLSIGLGFFTPVLARAGRRARRDLLQAAPPVAAVAALASVMWFLSMQRRGIAALALVTLLAAAGLAVLGLS